MGSGEERDGLSPEAVARTAILKSGGAPDDLEQVEALPAGWGAGAYRLHLRDGRRLVLKAKGPGDPPHQFEGVRREALFYRGLAADLPVKTPRIVGTSVEDALVFVLMDEYQAPPPAGDWAEEDIMRAASELGRFHAAYWDRTDALSGFTFLVRRSLEVTEDEIAHARACWAHVAGFPRLRDILTPERMRFLEDGINRVRQTQAYLAALPETLIHGDCHLGNILTDADGGFVWSDWAGAATGRGPEDLSFLYQRAVVAGGRVDFDRLLETYHAGLQPHIAAEVSTEALRDAAEASEWAVRLLQWPHYMDEATPESVRAFMDRIDALSESLFVR